MANQLELNEADMESYEAVVNELAEQLTEVSKIKDELTVNIIQLHHEKDEMIREKTEEWAEQKSQLVAQISMLQESISETNLVKIDYFEWLHKTYCLLCWISVTLKSCISCCNFLLFRLFYHHLNCIAR
jgi:vacuolar-type H+-ATPase subunit F/Vma7